MSVPPQPIRVLHVDDDPEFAELVRALLEREDGRISVDTAAGARDGLDRLAAGGVDCVVSDYDMPELGGLEFLEAVRERHPDLPFVLFTGKGSEEVASEAIRAGVTDYLQKGSGTEQYELLANRVRNAVQQYRAERSAEESERRLLEIAENTTDVLWMFTHDWGELLFVNSAYGDIWGRSVGALADDPHDFLDGVHPEDRALVEEAMAGLSGGDPVDVEYRVNESEDYGRWVWVQGYPIRDDAGAVVRVVGFARDVTDRKAREQRLSALHETTRTLIRAGSRENIAGIAVDAARGVLGLSVSGVFLHDGNDEVLVQVAVTPATEELLEMPATLERGGSIAWEVFESGETRLFDDVSAAEEAYNPETAIRSELILPLGDHGVFLASSTDVGEFDERTLVMAEVLTANVEAALDRARNHRRLRDRERRIQRLQERTRDLILASSKGEIAGIAVDAARTTLDLPYSGVYLLDEDGGALAPVAVTDEVREHFGTAPTYRRTGATRSVDAVHWDAFERGETVVVDDVRESDVVAETDTPTRSGIARPLGDHGVFVTTSAEPNAFDGTDTALMEVLATVVTAALDRVEREEQLRRERERFRTLFEHLPVAAIHATLTDGDPIVRRVNAQFEGTFGYEAEAVVGGNLDEFLSPTGEPEALRAVNRRLLEEGHVSTRVRRRTAEGVREFHAEVVLDDAGLEEPDAYAIYVDVTEPQRRLAALETLHEVSRELIHATTRPDIADLVVDAAAEILGFPLAMVRFYDPDEGGLVPVAWNDRVEEVFESRGTFRPGDGSLNWGAYESGEVRRYADVGELDRAHDADTALSSLMILPLGEHGTVTVGSTEADAFDEGDAYLARILATTAEAALSRTARDEELERQNEHLEQFTSIVSHDLRNPLNVAEGRLQLAAEECSSDHLDHVSRAHGRMRTLIDELLALAREGERVTRFEPVALARSAEAAWMNVDTGAASLVVTADRTVRADGSRLQQLLENLFRNAVEHGGDGVVVTVGELPSGFSVEDDGPGVPDAERTRVFDAGYSTGDGGTGFGLSIVREIVDAHGWDVRVVEGEEGGARFEVTGVSPAG